MLYYARFCAALVADCIYQIKRVATWDRLLCIPDILKEQQLHVSDTTRVKLATAIQT